MQGSHEGGGAFIYRVQRQGVPCGIPAGDRIPFHGAVLCDHVILLYEWCEEAEDCFYQGITSGYGKIFSEFDQNKYYLQHTGAEEQKLIAMQKKSDLRFYLYYRLRQFVWKLRA